jgi:YggT family protein
LFLVILLSLLILAIFARSIISWFVRDERNPFVRTLYDLTEPVLAPIRRVIPPIGGMIDITPMIAIIVLVVIRQAVENALGVSSPLPF